MRRRRNRLIAASITAALALLIVVGGTASGASPSTVVPPNGRVDGHIYSRWLAKWWLANLELPPSAPTCARRGNVLLTGLRGKPQRCHVRLGHPAYIPGALTECSTIEKPPFYGRTPAELKACARRTDVRTFSHRRLTVDGKAVRHSSSYVTASPVFRFHMPRINVLGLRKQSGRAAAYGAGFLLRDLAIGSHLIKFSARFHGNHYARFFRLNVKG